MTKLLALIAAASLPLPTFTPSGGNYVVEAAEVAITIDAPGIWSFVVTACDRSGKESPNVSNHIRVNYQP